MLNSIVKKPVQKKLQKSMKMNKILLITFVSSVLISGCSSRSYPPIIGQIEFKVTLEKESFKMYLSELGISSSSTSYQLTSSSGSNFIPVPGFSFSMPITNEVNIAIYPAQNVLSAESKSALVWGENNLSLSVYGERSVIYLNGTGPNGKVSIFVGEILCKNIGKNSYEIMLQKK